MAIKITELTFLNQLARRYNIPVPRHLETGASRAQLKQALSEWELGGLIKPDVMTGKRGKAGAIIPVSEAQDALLKLKQIANLEINGQMPRTAYLVENIPAKYEVFSAITYNSAFLSPTLTVSLAGGMDIEEVEENLKVTIPVDIFRGLDAYQASNVLRELNCEKRFVGLLSRTLVSFWDMFISTGMLTAEINPWRITPEGRPFACDFKATFDEANYKAKIPNLELPDYPENTTAFEEDMAAWSESSHQGQAHVSALGGKKILPILFGGGASTIIIETLEIVGGDPIFLSDFGGNPPYERMYGTARRCFDYHLDQAQLLLILGGKANNTFIDVTFQAIGDALIDCMQEKKYREIPVVVGRGGPRLVKGMLALKQALEYLKLPYVMFGPETPVTLVADYAARLAKVMTAKSKGGKK